MISIPFAAYMEYLTNSNASTHTYTLYITLPNAQCIYAYIHVPYTDIHGEYVTCTDLPGAKLVHFFLRLEL